MDPFDEFEFKPLTEGLGFHKKKSENKADKLEAKNKRSTEPFLRDKGFSLLDEETTSSSLTPTLPRKTRHKIENFEESKATQIRAYPNPFTQTLNLEIPESSGKHVKVSLFNAQGKAPDEVILPTGNVVLPTAKPLPVGLYFLRLFSVNQTTVLRLIKQ